MVIIHLLIIDSPQLNHKISHPLPCKKSERKDFQEMALNETIK